MPDKTKPKPSRIMNPFYWCEAEILRLVIQPKIEHCVVAEMGGYAAVESKTQLWQQFQKSWNCQVPYSRFSQWLVDLGYICDKQFVFQAPPGQRPTQPGGDVEDLSDLDPAEGLNPRVQVVRRGRGVVPNVGGIRPPGV